ncbi:MAG: DUF2924 domain-containing protein [Sphingomonas fennica]
MTPALAMQLERLPTMSATALRGEWLRVLKHPAPDITADLLRRGIAYRLQEKAMSGLSPWAKKEIERLCRVYAEKGEVAPPRRKIKLGTWLVRDWGGRSHHVLVVDGGFLYREQRYRSLSTIATKITGTRWSGPRFFGLLKGAANA